MITTKDLVHANWRTIAMGKLQAQHPELGEPFLCTYIDHNSGIMCGFGCALSPDILAEIEHLNLNGHPADTLVNTHKLVEVENLPIVQVTQSIHDHWRCRDRFDPRSSSGFEDLPKPLHDWLMDHPVPPPDQAFYLSWLDAVYQHAS